MCHMPNAALMKYSIRCRSYPCQSKHAALLRPKLVHILVTMSAVEDTRLISSGQLDYHTATSVAPHKDGLACLFSVAGLAVTMTLMLNLSAASPSQLHMATRNIPHPGLRHPHCGCMPLSVFTLVAVLVLAWKYSYLLCSSAPTDDEML